MARARKLRKWSQETLAEKLDMSRIGVQQIERGRRIPSVPALIHIAETLGLSLDEMVGLKPLRTPTWAEEAVALLRSTTPVHRKVALEFLRYLATAHPTAPPKRRSATGGRR